MIREIVDPDIINGFANHSEIRSVIAPGNERLDLSAGVQPPNVCMAGEHGCFCWIATAPQEYEIHVMMTRAGRGKWGFEAAQEAMRRIIEHGAGRAWGRVSKDRPDVAVFARKAGWKDTGQTETLDIGFGPTVWRIFDWRKN